MVLLELQIFSYSLHLILYIQKDPNNVKALVDKLEQKKLIKRTPNPNDKRAFSLSTTDKGIELINTLNQVDISVISDVEKSLTTQENIQLLELLSKIEKNFSSSPK